MTTPSTAPTPLHRKIILALSEGEADDILADLPLGHSVSEATRNLYRRLRDERRQPQGDSVPHPADQDDDVIYAPMQPVRHAPEKLPRRGLVIRNKDITGISGLGVIAEFTVFSDGATAWRWLGGPPQDQPKFEFYDKPGIDPFVQISQSQWENSEIVWIDEETAPQQ